MFSKRPGFPPDSSYCHNSISLLFLMQYSNSTKSYSLHGSIWKMHALFRFSKKNKKDRAPHKILYSEINGNYNQSPPGQNIMAQYRFFSLIKRPFVLSAGSRQPGSRAQSVFVLCAEHNRQKPFPSAIRESALAPNAGRLSIAICRRKE